MIKRVQCAQPKLLRNNIRSNIFLAVFLSILLIPFNSIGQNDKSPLFFNELTISVNRTFVEDENTMDRFGFGIGVFRSWVDSSWFNVLMGISYNKTSQLKFEVYNGRYSHISDVTYNLHSITVPLIARLNIGNSAKFFVEPGVFMELVVGASREGTFHTAISGQDYTTSVHKERINLSGLNGGYLLGLGSIVPVKKHELIFKLEYQSAIKFLEDNQESIFNRYARISVGIRKN